ncbi:hypothetical protein [Candidatus Paracaedibacter symbiosus]|uniref:hypothetical protein n=1 Tax=Candidatus Paracaedibacter symbiosus TaxID=244582 RepID=UPI000509BE01|nr:hypothetical protein [Candidatus Paracaedibacter symbiosus]
MASKFVLTAFLGLSLQTITASVKATDIHDTQLDIAPSHQQIAQLYEEFFAEPVSFDFKHIDNSKTPALIRQICDKGIFDCDRLLNILNHETLACPLDPTTHISSIKQYYEVMKNQTENLEELSNFSELLLITFFMQLRDQGFQATKLTDPVLQKAGDRLAYDALLINTLSLQR